MTPSYLARLGTGTSFWRPWIGVVWRPISYQTNIFKVIIYMHIIFDSIRIVDLILVKRIRSYSFGYIGVIILRPIMGVASQ